MTGHEERVRAMEQQLRELERTPAGRAVYDDLMERALLQAALGERDGHEDTVARVNFDRKISDRAGFALVMEHLFAVASTFDR